MSKAAQFPIALPFARQLDCRCLGQLKDLKLRGGARMKRKCGESRMEELLGLR